MKIRVCTRDVPLFDHAGMKLTERWQVVDLEKLGLPAAAAILKYRGHIVQIHSEDAAKFEELIPSIESALKAEDDRAAAAKVKADKVAAKDELSQARRAAEEHREAAMQSAREAQKLSVEARNARAEKMLAEDDAETAKGQARAANDALEALRTEHELLKAELAIAKSAPPATEQPNPESSKK